MKKQATGTVLDDLPIQFVVDEQLLDEIVYRAEEKHAASKANKSAWEGAAKQQRLEKQRAILENHKLRSQVNEYAVFIELIQASMHMKPPQPHIGMPNMARIQTYSPCCTPSRSDSCHH
ncbi:hypothetical protein Ae201684P_002670 [Aphanomyces euteiches]|nr:hypothetical protein Ae201684P_002670 [Aphanomyces euteiches]